jgi:transposase
MSKRSRRRYTPDQKAALLREHLVDNKPVSEICTAAEIQPRMFYKWERDLLAAAAPSLFTTRRAPNREQELQARVPALEAKVIRKDAIIAEVSEEYVKLKKELAARSGTGPGRRSRRDRVWLLSGDRSRP